MSNSSVIPWILAYQASLFMGLTRQEYWSGLTFPSPGDSPKPRDQIPVFCTAGRFFTTEPNNEKGESFLIIKTHLIGWRQNEDGSWDSWREMPTMCVTCVGVNSFGEGFELMCLLFLGLQCIIKNFSPIPLIRASHPPVPHS